MQENEEEIQQVADQEEPHSAELHQPCMEQRKNEQHFREMYNVSNVPTLVGGGGWY